jgi:hypothetical protein
MDEAIYLPYGTSPNLGEKPLFHSKCLLIGNLVFRSTFLPRILGALMAFAGLGWLTYLSLPLVNHLFPYNLAFAILAELSLMLWLLVMGVNVQRWREQASAALERRLATHRA